ncbi:MAG: ABC transporter substrate-binding protein [Actinobacteria bacterium]|nr:ABC transporter substrate-binding protein [Actinomycetota bacterium]
MYRAPSPSTQPEHPARAPSPVRKSMSVPTRRRLSRRGRRELLALAAAVPILVAVTACSTSPAPTPEPSSDPITIAVEAALTGDLSANGQDILRGAQLAVDQANESGGVLGRQIVIIEADDKADPATGIALAQEIVDGPAVAVVGIDDSSVGLKNLPLYINGEVVPVHMTSSDDTAGEGVTIRPKNSQISPVEVAYIKGLNATNVSMLVDPSAYTQGMADRLSKALNADGITVTMTPIVAGKVDYTEEVTAALSSGPNVVYVSTYYPEGSVIANALAVAAAGGSTAACFMGLGNQDPGFISAAGIPDSQGCVFSGVPTPDEFPAAADFISAYTAKFSTAPGVWSVFAYDSVRLLLNAMTSANSTDYAPVLEALTNSTDFAGATGPITIVPATGIRPNAPVTILKVTSAGAFALAS